MNKYKLIRQYLADNVKLHKLLAHYSNGETSALNNAKTLIYMCDGRIHHGGLSDRLWGMISTYDYCLQHNLKFKALWNFPYELSTFLEPNLYDWSIDNKNIQYNHHISAPIVISHRPYIREQIKLANKCLDNKHNQLHIYTNMRYSYPGNFRYLFKELFKPTNLLRQAIIYHQHNLPENYVSLTFRFQQLLGDLNEKNFKTLDALAQNRLIDKAFNYIEHVHNKHPGIPQFLVTSDSIKFLSQATQNFPYVYIIPGKIVHMDYDGMNSGIEIHLKSFVDMFMIAGAKTVYNAVLPPLYRTDFPYTASLIYGSRYIDIHPYMI